MLIEKIKKIDDDAKIQNAVNEYRNAVVSIYDEEARNITNISALIGELLAMNEVIYDCGRYEDMHKSDVYEYVNPAFCDREALRKIYVPRFADVFIYVRLGIYCDSSVWKSYGSINVNKSPKSSIEKTETILRDYYEREENITVFVDQDEAKESQLKKRVQSSLVIRPTACKDTWKI